MMRDDTGTACDDRVRPRREGAEGPDVEIEGGEGGNHLNSLVARESPIKDASSARAGFGRWV